MKELSLHILDIIQNSIAAGAALIQLDLTEDSNSDLLMFRITDNGCGMPPEMVRQVMDPFTTSRKTRKVGLGIPLLKAAAEHTGGGICISSEPGRGTVLEARFGYSHIDRQPLGNMAETMLGLVTGYDSIDFVYHHKVNEKEFTMDTREIKSILGEVSLKEPEVMLWLSDFLKENEAALYGEEMNTRKE
ncbi:ATP-binding protein [Ructibacterium gallinarum]|uniref:histidine kinase n=1 Tax=Ructibacterium gallinarum TaxID=2779355 RepID=A0A9D5M5S3_9FIRM|nr:ATP-binding protein [Ructibacterium gallinarum]MBE5039992.1 sensor histidine kinase [Ructibacterium gallinarum]